MTQRELERKINRAKEKLDALKEREEYLSKYGCWSIGYFQGRISALEEWLDEIKE